MPLDALRQHVDVVATLEQADQPAAAVLIGDLQDGIGQLAEVFRF